MKYKNLCSKLLSIIIAIVVLVSITPISVNSADNFSWKKCLDTHINSLKDVVFGNDIFVAVGDDGTIITSKDGTKWTHVNSGTIDQLLKVVWNGNTFVAIGEKTILVSKDAVKWTVVKTDNEWVFTNLIWTGDLLVATSVKDYYSDNETSKIMTSMDGIQWTKRSELQSYRVMDIIWANNMAIIVGAKNTNGFIATSSDLVNWNINNLITENGLSNIVTNGEEILVNDAFGYIYESTDAINWNLILKLSTEIEAIYNIFWDGKQYLAVGDDIIVKTSEDGIEWKPVNLITKSKSYIEGRELVSLAYGNNTYVAVGFLGEIIISSDSSNWSIVSERSYYRLNDVKWNGTVFVGVGAHGLIVTSKDGLTWTRRESNTKANLHVLIWDKKLFTASGGSGEILYSVNGINWKCKKTERNFYSNSVAWNGHSYVALDLNNDLNPLYSKTFYVSKNGLDWSKSNPKIPFSHWSCINWTGNQFVVTSENTILTSKDGIKWNSPIKHKLGKIDDISYNGKCYCVINSDDIIYTSKDLRTWKKVLDPEYTYFRNIDCIKNQFFVLGMFGLILTSKDGVKWTKAKPITDHDLYGIAYNGSCYVVFGGVVLTTK